MTDRFGSAVAAVVGRLLKRRRLALAGAALLLGALALVASRLELDEDLAAFLPLDEPRIQEQLRVLRAFRGLETLRVDLELETAGVGSTTETERARLHVAAAAFEAALEPSVAPLVSRVVSGPSPDALGAWDDLVRRSLPSLVEPGSVAAILERFETDEALDALLAQHVLTLNQLEGPFLKDHVRRDPLGFETPLFEGLRSLGASFGGARLEEGRLVSADGRHALVVVEPSVPSSRTEDASKVLELIESAGARASAAAGVPVKAIVAGGHRASVENARAIKRDSWLTSLVSLAAMVVVYAWVFPRRWLIPLTALPLAAGGVIGAALSHLLLGRVSAIAFGFGGILLGLADDFIVLLYYCFETRSREHHARGATGTDPRVEAVGRVARPLVAAGAAIAAAFLALAVSGFRGQRDLAVFATTSLAGTLAATLLVHPLLLPTGPSRRPLRDTAALLRALVRAVERHRGVALALALAATLALGWAATHLRFEDDPRAIDGSSVEAKEAEAILARDFGDQRGAILAVARGPDLESALEQRERVEGRLDDLAASGRIGRVLHQGALAPSGKTQERRRAGWRALFTPERRAALAERFARVAPRHHFSPRAFEPFFARLAGEGEPVDVATLERGPLADALPRVAVGPDGALALALAFPVPGAPPDLAWASDVEHETGALVGTLGGLARELVAAIRVRLWRCGGLAFALVLAILYPALGSVRRTAAAALAISAGLVWSLGALALLGAALNPINFLIPVLVFGLAVDDAILLATAHAPTADAASGVLESEAQGGVLASSVTTLAGIASLLLARHPAVFSIGLVALVGTAATFVAIVVIIPAMLGGDLRE